MEIIEHKSAYRVNEKADTTQLRILLCVVLAGFTLLYTFNLGGSLMHDDEGAAFYEAWQLYEGRQPGVDFIAENQPLFLLAGRQVIDLAGRSPTALRLLSVIPPLLGAAFLAVALGLTWNWRIATLATVFILTDGILYEQARIYRPDAMMLGWEMAGLAAVLLAVHRQQRRWWAVAGLCYGGAVLWKLFGVFPVIGLALYFGERLWKDRHNRSCTVKDGLAFALPFILSSVVVSIILYGQLGFYYGEAFGHHATMDQDITLLHLVGRNILAYLLLLVSAPAFFFLGPLLLLNRKSASDSPPLLRILLWQLATLLVFFLITRPLHIRYFLFLIPTLAILLAWQIDCSLKQIEKSQSNIFRYFPLVVAIFFLFALFTSLPSIPKLSIRTDNDTWPLAHYVAQLTEPSDTVLADYATINFLADRPSIYEASIIAGAQIETGIITTELILKQIEAYDVQMVLLHVEGGDPVAHHFVNLDDYERFRRYLRQEFNFIQTLDRNGQQIEIYKRKNNS